VPQGVCGVQFIAPGEALNCPAGQLSHVVAPALAAKVPAAHGGHVAATTLVPLLAVPGPHGLHMRSELAVPSVLTRVPGPQSV
jgi:hypothetical protein